MSLRIGVDTGGTFTDLCVYDDVAETLHVHKISSTPADPGQAVVDGIVALLSKMGARQAAEISYVAHGTTVGTNALLTHRGVTTGLITTRGFRDLLELGRGRRPHMYDSTVRKPDPLVPRSLRFEVTERIRYDGTVATPLDEDEVRAAVRELKALGAVSIAVCFLYSYLVPDHEQRVAGIIAEEYPEAYVSVSSAVLPEFREYERLSTVVTNAYIGPVVADYLGRLQSSLRESGVVARPNVTQSNGGVIPFEAAQGAPIRLVLSGPSTGVVGAAEISTMAGFPNIITFDMGGTSSDISLVQHGEPKLTSGTEFEGRPIRSPMLDIHTVGAGGGSIGWIDSGGHLRVGPASAGADPGPACYGLGDLPTVTDANVVLGMLNPGYLLSGSMRINREAARTAIASIGEAMGLGVEETALGMLSVVTANMARAIRVVSVQRGYDPRDYALAAFGGAGPLHASRLAAELGIGTVIVPPTPGAQSALGLLMTDSKTDLMRTAVLPVGPDSGARIDAAFAVLEAEAEDWFMQQSAAPGDRSLVRRVDMRYVGQNFELTVPVTAPLDSSAAVEQLVSEFVGAHRRLYGYALDGAAVEVVTLRLSAVIGSPVVAVGAPAVTDQSAAAATHRRVLFGVDRGYEDCLVYQRSTLRHGQQVMGPAIIEQMDSTTVIMPGDLCAVDDSGNVVIKVGGAQQ